MRVKFFEGKKAKGASNVELLMERQSVLQMKKKLAIINILTHLDLPIDNSNRVRTKIL